jgi:hypothetical protein
MLKIATREQERIHALALKNVGRAAPAANDRVPGYPDVIYDDPESGAALAAAESHTSVADLMQKAVLCFEVEQAITRHDRVQCSYHPDWEPNFPFEFRHNQVVIEIGRARELLPNG